MPFVLPSDPVTGATAPVTWGDAVRDGLNYLANPPACRAYHNTTQSLTDNTETTVLFNAERYDTDTMHSTSTNTGRITFNTAGLYVVGFLIEVAAAADYTLCYTSLRLNGTTPLFEDVSYADPVAAANVHLGGTTVYKFAAADYVEIRAYQDNTANAARNITNAANRSPEFWATWIGLG